MAGERAARHADAQLERLDELITPLVTARAPGLLKLYGVGPDAAATLPIAAGDHPGRLRSEAALAHLCDVAQRDKVPGLPTGAENVSRRAILHVHGQARLQHRRARCRDC